MLRRRLLHGAGAGPAALPQLGGAARGEGGGASGFTLIDLRPLRPLLSAARTKTADPELMRIVYGFDAVLVLTGSHPSRMLP